MIDFNRLFYKKKYTSTKTGIDQLKRVFTARDLTFLGIAAIIGAGSFSSLGAAIFSGGPGVVLLFIICAIACGFTAFCYSEFATRIPVSGSAYTYAYASFGELFAWIIGWMLLMEYSIGNIYMTYSWSDYFTSLLSVFKISMPDYLTCSYLEAKNFIAENTTAITKLKPDQLTLYHAWNNAPKIGGLRLIFDLPALIINLLITVLVYRGVTESKKASNFMVILKLSIIFLIIVIGIYFIIHNHSYENWTPIGSKGIPSFMPNGFSGVMATVGSVFFAYIGFDAISTMAEESKNPQRDLPRGMILSLIICTVIYIILALVLTGLVSFTKFENVGDPLAFIFEEEQLNLPFMHFIVAIVALVAMTSVILVFQMGQPRIWLTMSRDKLLPPAFERIHPTYKTPSFSTIVTGLIVGLPILFTDKKFVLDFTSIGTLFAFVLVCGGILIMPRRSKEFGKFHLPYFNAQYFFPIAILLIIIYLTFFKYNTAPVAQTYFHELFNGNYTFSDKKMGANLFFATSANKIATIIFWLILILLAILSYLKKYSMIPLLGLISCLYLLTGMGAEHWRWFFLWMIIGIVIYLAYGYRKNKFESK